MQVYDEKKQILKYLKDMKAKLENDGIVRLGLFGSFAKNKADIASDIDIVICSSEVFVKKFDGFGALIYLDELRQKLMQRFKRQVDICDVFSMSEEKQRELLKGVIYV